MPANRNIAIGDVYSLPLDGNHRGYCQIVGRRGNAYYMIAFDHFAVTDEAIDLEILISKPIIYLGFFFNSLIKSGEWKLLGNKSPDYSKIPNPCHRVIVEGKVYVETWDRKRSRLATPEEANLLDNETDSGPVWLEDALKSRFKQCDDSEYIRYSYSYAKSRELL